MFSKSEARQQTIIKMVHEKGKQKNIHMAIIYILKYTN
jgi:hypothetical protein